MAREKCPEPNKPGCPYARRCYSDQHHLFWPANRYKTGLEKRFRQLPENKEQTCRWEHDEAHFEAPPIKPSIQEMRDAIAGIAIEEWGDDAA